MWWRRRESNPRPKACPRGTLHACPFLFSHARRGETANNRQAPDPVKSRDRTPSRRSIASLFNGIWPPTTRPGQGRRSLLIKQRERTEYPQLTDVPSDLRVNGARHASRESLPPSKPFRPLSVKTTITRTLALERHLLYCKAAGPPGQALGTVARADPRSAGLRLEARRRAPRRITDSAIFRPTDDRAAAGIWSWRNLAASAAAARVQCDGSVQQAVPVVLAAPPALTCRRHAPHNAKRSSSACDRRDPVSGPSRPSLDRRMLSIAVAPLGSDNKRVTGLPPPPDRTMGLHENPQTIGGAGRRTRAVREHRRQPGWHLGRAQA